MGMTIDDAIPILHDMYNYYNDVNVDAYVGFDNEDNNAIETALETMRKYEKIVEIVTEWQNETDPKIKFARSNIEKIKEVIEDGKID